MKAPPELLAHREWLGQIGQVGLVVSPNVLVRLGVIINRQEAIEAQTKLAELVTGDDDDEPRITDVATFFREILGWHESLIAGAPGGPLLPDSLVAPLPEYEDHIRPTYAVPAPGKGSTPEAGEWLCLIQVVDAGLDFDKAPALDKHDHGWRASPHARLERLLRDTGVGIGILINGTSLRLVYAPRGESSGHLTFRFRYLLETQGRPMAGALCALLGVDRVTERFDGADLAKILKDSRKSQNDVSTELAGQVLEALWELVRGFQHANEASKGQLLEHSMREAPNEVYGGLLTTLMRLVFVLYAEDRGLMPVGDVYQRHYSVAGLFEKLREDAARYPDTMDARYGAWAQLLALFRLIHHGGRHGSLRFTARHGRLFDPDAYPSLEGRPHGTRRSKGERVDPPRVSDGVVYRVLRNLLLLDGERLSYRALDVEQIGSVYEAMMGFALEQAPGPSIAVSPKHIVINIDDLLEQKGSERAKWLQKQGELKLSSEDALAKAATADDVVAALGKKVSRYTPSVLPPTALYLQPTEERRRSGSHYTPRSLTEPIVRTTFRPIFERLGEQATPEQILDLKVCDPAMGSGAFLVEACRLLSERLVRAWEVHKQTPKVPDDEDVLTYARRLVAERCLYGVDKNVFAVDLAKLSLWLATLAREHPFTFLDHALRLGDSLVGLSREQIACFNWEVEAQMPLLRSLIDERVAEAQRLREQIQGLATSDDVPRKEHLLRDSEEALADVRLIGDLVISAFFEREKPKERKAMRIAYAGQVEQWLTSDTSARGSWHSVPSADRTVVRVDSGVDLRSELAAIAGAIRDDPHPISPFHWQIEFPEVFTRPNPGFEVFVGNPPFAGKNTMAAANRANYPVWLQAVHEESHGNSDLVAHFYRRAFALLRKGGAFGLIATNTIAQGDTRGTGLRWIRQHGGVIFEARKRIRWPGAAAVVVSVVHVSNADLQPPFTLDGKRVNLVTAFLFHAGTDTNPQTLSENSGGAFRGMEVGLTSLILHRSDPDYRTLAPIPDPRYPGCSLVKPYIGGQEILGHPHVATERFVVDLDGLDAHFISSNWQLAEFANRVASEVVVRDSVGSRPMELKFRRPSLLLRQRVCRQSRILALVRHTDTAALQFLPSCVIPNEATICFASASNAGFCTLQSRVHELWYRFLGSSIKDDPRYTPSDCFETFPCPKSWDSQPSLEDAGQRYYDLRDTLMVRNNEGLTDTYNRFHDPDESDTAILRLRELHDAMDRAVLDAYGWADIQPHCEFILDYEDEEDHNPGKPSKKHKPYRYRWPDDIRDEVLGRLLELNAERARQETLAAAKSSATAARGSKRAGKPVTPLLD